ncbi:hypothetical protein HID58_058190 [Brassica napus]|uniref:Uncharacterized protein n=1 Tax=Brassica napus TaxID=3708 RepID=A0ABQ7ZPF1_BRANA|nr:hypothetical protein HID58_058190 [Brassica napus]
MKWSPPGGPSDIYYARSLGLRGYAILSLSVARVEETVTALSVGLGEEGKQRPFYLSIGASGELSLYRWLSETMNNATAAVEANRKVDRSRGMRHDPGGLMKTLSEWFDEEASHRFMRQRAYDCSYSGHKEEISLVDVLNMKLQNTGSS